MDRYFVTKVIAALLVVCALVGAWFWYTRPAPSVVEVPRLAPTEREITIIPGWDLRDVAAYLEKAEVASSTAVLALTGEPAKFGGPAEPIAFSSSTARLFASKPTKVNLEGYLAPNTYRIYKTAGAADVVEVLVNQRDRDLTAFYTEIVASKRTVHEILTLASLLEKEVRHPADRALVADIFWRRHDVGMGLQADSSVHYVVGKEGEVFTTAADRASENLWNTYKYPGLPPGPISNPSVDSIQAALRPQANDYWYFLTTLDTGEVKYAGTLAEHNKNVRRFLKKK